MSKQFDELLEILGYPNFGTHRGTEDRQVTIIASWYACPWVAVPAVEWLVVVLVVCLNAALAVEVLVYVSTVPVGISALNAARPHIATMPASQFVCAADSVAELVVIQPIDQGNPPDRVPPALCR